MRASVLRDGVMVTRDDVPVPVPGTGEVLIQVIACGVCGGDLHFAKHNHQLADLADKMTGAPTLTEGLDLNQDIYMGHEYVGKIIVVGPETNAPAVGTVVTSMPALMTEEGMRPRLYSNVQPGGYAEQMVLSAELLVPVPDHVDPKLAALAEPLAVGLHAVNRAELDPTAGAIVIGSGPAGVAVIAALKAEGVHPIVASDFSPARRELAKHFGADVVIDPAVEHVFDAWSRVGSTTPTVFECVGVPGMLDDVLRRTPYGTNVVVVGASMEPDTISPYFGIAKEARLQFVQAYSPDEFSETLRRIADDEIDVRPMITGEMGIEQVQDAFDALTDPEQHCKILIVPAP